ncbi:uncharacterized protein [Dysidea avara]|uniref:uncharacterized protein n=1 Tax=Dysidea avara TaxID=196820 RepID=UPI00332A32EC
MTLRTTFIVSYRGLKKVTLCESYTQSIKKPAFNQLEKGCEIELLIKGKKLCGKLELTGSKEQVELAERSLTSYTDKDNDSDFLPPNKGTKRNSKEKKKRKKVTDSIESNGPSKKVKKEKKDLKDVPSKKGKGKKKSEEPDDCFILAISNHGGKVVSSSDEVKIASTEENTNSKPEEYGNIDNEINDVEENMEIVESGKMLNNLLQLAAVYPRSG